MQRDRPFVDGLVMHTGSTPNCPAFAFNREKWTRQSLWFDDLVAIGKRSPAFRQNFLMYWPQADRGGPDFFDDELWNQIIENAKLFSTAVKLSGARGIFFDPEYYAGNASYSPWWYEPEHAGQQPPYRKRSQSFQIVANKAHERGFQLMKAFSSDKPDIVLLSTFLYSGVWSHCNGDPNRLARSQYALLAAFTDGMLEAHGVL
jgi:hypothetical protein